MHPYDLLQELTESTPSDSSWDTSSSKSEDSQPEEFHLLSRLLPGEISYLDSKRDTLEQCVSTMEMYKFHIENTFNQFRMYPVHTQDRSLSWHIFNAHIRNFRDSFMALRKYMKADEVNYRWRRSCWSGTPVWELAGYEACERLLEYNFQKPEGMSSSDDEETVSLFGNMVSDVGSVCTLAKGLAQQYWDQELCTFYCT